MSWHYFHLWLFFLLKVIDVKYCECIPKAIAVTSSTDKFSFFVSDSSEGTHMFRLLLWIVSKLCRIALEQRQTLFRNCHSFVSKLVTNSFLIPESSFKMENQSPIGPHDILDFSVVNYFGFDHLIWAIRFEVTLGSVSTTKLSKPRFFTIEIR